MRRSHKKVWYRIHQDDDITLKEIADKIREIQEAHPELDVFFDGDEFAICSIPAKEKKKTRQSRLT